MNSAFPAHPQRSSGRLDLWLTFLAALGFLLAEIHLVFAQEWQFSFDARGNLQTQVAANASLPQILSQPQTQVVGPGDLASFFVVVGNPQSLSYQWLLNGANLAGATRDALLLTNVAAANEGQYSVVLVNGFGSVTSAPAGLMLDTDRDGLPDSWELAYFGNLNQNATADLDGDGISNLREFLDQTSPTNSASARYRLVVVNDGGTVTLSPNLPSYTNGQVVQLTASPPEEFHAWTGDIVTRNNPITVVMSTNKTIQARFTPIAITWTNLAGGDWSLATNWSPNLVPAANDNALVTNTVTVTVSADAEVGNLNLGIAVESPTLTGPGTLTLHGTSVWANASFSGTGRTLVASSASVVIANNGSMYMTTRALENGGTVLWNGTGPLVLFGSVVLTNRSGALFELQNASAFAYGSGAISRFDNSGTLRKSVNRGTSTFIVGVPLNNYGTIDLQAGTLLCNDLFLNNGAVSVASSSTNRPAGGGSGSGSFTVAPNGLVEWTGPFTLDPGAQLDGLGLYRVASVLTCNADFSVQNLDLVSTFISSGTVTINGLMSWNGILKGSGRTIISPGATLATSAGTYLDGHVLENAGTILWTGPGYIAIQSGAVLTNRSGAVFDAQNAASLQSGFGGGRFDNAGIFRKSISPGTTMADAGVTVNNFGMVDIQSGTLLCSGPFLNNGLVSISSGSTNRLVGVGSGNGSFTAAPDGVVEWSGTFTLGPGAQLKGAGVYRVPGGTLACDADLSVQNLDLTGTLTGTGTLTIGRLMNWNGILSGNGRTIISPGATLVTSTGTYLDHRVLENAGTILWTGTGYIALQNGGVLTNRPGGVFEAQNAALILSGFGGGRFDNAGTLRKSLSSGTTSLGAGITFTNYGVVDLLKGILSANGGYNSSGAALLNCAIGGPVPATNYAQLQVAGAVNLNGGLSVKLTDGYAPSTNDAFTVVTAGSLASAFASFTYPSNQVTMELSNTVNSVIVRVTHGTHPQALLLKPAISGLNVFLAWTAVSNRTYRLEFKPDLGPGTWIAIPGDVTAETNAAFKVDTFSQSNRFYRVQELP